MSQAQHNNCAHSSSRKNRNVLGALLGIVLIGLYVGCAGEGPTPTATTTPSPLPTSTFTPTPTLTPVPIYTPTPTPTPGGFGVYQVALAILSTSPSILPLVADIETGSYAATFLTIGSESATFTWSEPPIGFDISPGLQGSVPVVTFNGTDEDSETPDANYWSRGNGSSDNAFGMGLWINVTDTAADRVLLSKWGQTTREWYLHVDTADTLRLAIADESTNATAFRETDSPISQGAWTFVAASYDGMGGATAADGITLYVDGASVASSATNSRTYAAMENRSARPRLGSRINLGSADSFFNGKIAGGPCGPFFTHEALTSTLVQGLYSYCRTLMGLP